MSPSQGTFDVASLGAMALSNTAADTAHSESGRLTKRKGGSPISSGVTASNSVASQESRLAVSEERRPMNLELHQFPKTPVREGAKEATTHDFLSLYKNAAVTGDIELAAAQGMVPPSTTLNFLHPLEKCAQPIGGNILTAGLLPSNGQMSICRVTNASCYGGVQGASYGHSSGTIELTTKSTWMDGLERGLKGVKERLDDHADWSTSQLKFGSLELGHVAKTGSTHSQLEGGQHHMSSHNKQWQNLGPDLCSMMKEPHKVIPKANKDEENSECNNESEENDVLNLKGNVLRKMDGKNNDCKASTPRSKHSATEQRRRSKINDRFQMLRQLVPNTDQKRDKASFLLEVIEYIQVLQEKLRNYEATEHGRKQQRLKCITRDLPQRSSGLQDFVPIVSTVPSDWKKGTASFLGRPRSSSLQASDEYGSNGHVSLPVDKAIEDSQPGHPNHEKGATSKSTPPSLSVQLPAYILSGRDSNLPNISVLRSFTEAHMLNHPRPDDKTLLPLSINQVEALLPVPYENSRPPQLLCDMDDKQRHEFKEREYGFSQHDANSETCSKNLENGKGNPGLDMEPSVAGLLQNKDACVSKQCGGLKNAFVHTPETLQTGITSTSLLKPVFVQGDNVKISSVYSQKLLDILSSEFQCSGFDLSKTSISVQINFGKAASQSTDIQQQFPGHGKHPAPQGQEDFNKRPKIFSKS